MRLLARLMGHRDPDLAKSMISTYTGVLAGLKMAYAGSLAEGDFEKTADLQEKIAIAASRIVQIEEDQAALYRFRWGGGDWKITAAALVAALAIIFALAVALGGGIFAGSAATTANGGVYLINRYTGDVHWCLPGGGCRSL